MHVQLVVVAKLDAELSEDSVHFACACSSPWHAHLLILKEEVHKDSTLCDALASWLHLHMLVMEVEPTQDSSHVRKAGGTLRSKKWS